MIITIDGKKVTDISSLINQIAESLREPETEPVYFGWDLHSFGDCLQGGCFGQPPYHIVVENADVMIRALDHRALVHYCNEMLTVINRGGRGLIQEDGRHWFELERDKAEKGEGKTLLDLVFDVIRNAPASMSLYSCHGLLLARVGRNHEMGSAE